MLNCEKILGFNLHSAASSCVAISTCVAICCVGISSCVAIFSCVSISSCVYISASGFTITNKNTYAWWESVHRIAGRKGAPTLSFSEASRCECPRKGFLCPCPRGFFRFPIFPLRHVRFHCKGSMDLVLGGKKQRKFLCVRTWHCDSAPTLRLAST